MIQIGEYMRKGKNITRMSAHVRTWVVEATSGRPCTKKELNEIVRLSGAGFGVGGPGQRLKNLNEASFRRWLAELFKVTNESKIELWRAFQRSRLEYIDASVAINKVLAPLTRDERTKFWSARERSELLAKRALKLTSSIQEHSPPKDASEESMLQRKCQELEKVKSEAQKLEQEQAAMEAKSPEVYAALRRAYAELDRLCEASGIRAAEKCVKELNVEVAKQTKICGDRMESITEQEWRSILVLPRGFDKADERLCALKNVTVNSKMEFDLMVVRDNGPGVPVTVAAIVECKYNADDIGKAFGHYQESLSWLCGEHHRYNPKNFQTSQYPSGHFDHPLVLMNGTDPVILAPVSFSHFRRDPRTQFHLAHLYFATLLNTGSLLQGCNSGTRECLRAMVVSVPKPKAIQSRNSVLFQDYNLDNPSATTSKVIRQIWYLLLNLTKKTRHTTSDVFQLYAQAGLANHIIRFSSLPTDPPPAQVVTPPVEADETIGQCQSS